MNLRGKILPITIGLMISGLFFSCTGEPETTDPEQGSDMSVEVEDNKSEVVYETKVEEVYKVSKESYFLDDGSANGYKEFSYDDRGNLTGIVNYRGSGDLLFEEKYELDEKGNILKAKLFDSEGLTSYTVYTYDDNGLLIGEEYYNHRDLYLSGSRFEYDKKNNKVLWESLDENKSLVLKAEYIYKGDDLIKVSFLTPLNKDDGSLDYSYRDDKVIKEVSINGSGKEERRTEYEYDDDMMIVSKIFQLGRLSRVNEMEYDNMGQKVKMMTYNRSKKLISHTVYEYVTFQEEKTVPAE
ncbi:MAG: hypothetical protein PQJ59_07125 [Spirochaetales bacterium]|nr:hypothetical protein [Spirochaetales bacterium]